MCVAISGHQSAPAADDGLIKGLIRTDAEVSNGKIVFVTYDSGVYDVFVGTPSDYKLRGKLDFFYLARSKLELSNVNFRDERAILKLASALLKIIAPNSAIINEEDLKLAIDLAVEYRQRVADWLHFLAPGEFEKKKIGYRIKA